MIKILIISFIFITNIIFAAGETPISNLKLTSNANGNGYDLINLNTVSVTNINISGELSLNGININPSESQDLSAMRTYHYGSTDIIESPSDWFVTDGMGTITNFNYTDDRKNVIIPWSIGGVPITNIGVNAFSPLFVGYAITNIIFPKY